MAQELDMIHFHYTDNEFIVAPRCDFVKTSIEIIEEPLLVEFSRREKDWLTFILNFEECSKIDANGITFLLRLHRHLTSLGHEFLLMNCNDSILRSLKLFRLDKKFPIGINKTSKQLEEEALRKAELLEQRNALRRSHR